MSTQKYDHWIWERIKGWSLLKFKICVRPPTSLLEHWSFKCCVEERSCQLHSSHLISSHLISTDLASFELNSSQCAVKRPSSPWLQPIRTKYVTLSRMIGYSHSKLGRFNFAAHSLSLSSEEMNSVETSSDELRWVIWTLHFYRAMHYSANLQSAVLRSLVVCPSVRLSVTLVNHDHIDWKSWRLIARTISPTSSLFVAPKGHPPTPEEHGEILGRKCSFNAYVHNTYIHNVRLNWVNRVSRDLRWRCGCLLFVYFYRRIAR